LYLPKKNYLGLTKQNDGVELFEPTLLSIPSRLFHMQKFDIIQTVGTASSYSFLSGKSCVAYPMGSDLRLCSFENNLLGFWLRMGFKASKKVLISGPYFNDAILKLGLKEKIIFMPHLIDTKKIRSRMKKFDGKKIRLLLVGSLNFKIKKTDELLAAFFALPEKTRKKFKFFAIRQGPNVQEVEKKYGNEITFIERLPKEKLFELFGQIDVVADQFDYLEGTMGLSCFEAMASAKPVLSTVYDKTNETHTSYIENYGSLPPLLNCRNRREIINNLLEIAENPDYCIKIGLACRKWVENHNSPKKVIPLYKKLYENILSSSF